MDTYTLLQSRLASGWNTFNTRSVLSHVLMPDGLGLNLGLFDLDRLRFLDEALIGRQRTGHDHTTPGLRSYDDTYTEVTVRWSGIEVLIQTATADDGRTLVLLVTPRQLPPRGGLLVVQANLLWNLPGCVARYDQTLVANLPHHGIRIAASAPAQTFPHMEAQGPYLALPLAAPLAITAGHPTARTWSAADAAQLMAQRQQARARQAAPYGTLAPLYDAIQTSMAWDTIYDFTLDRVISPVSRIWNTGWGGFVLFCWDTYFAAALASIDNQDLAFTNAVAITRALTPAGFVPNFAATHANCSYDRSQPPVGSMTIWDLFERFGDRWILEETFDNLLTWNRWWPAHRDRDGYLVWGSDPNTEPGQRASQHVNDHQAAAFESGLDNSPMFDDMPYDAERHQMLLADVGLMGLYIGDCTYLAKIAAALDQPAVVQELRARAAHYTARLQTLWDDKFGMFLNKRLDTGEFQYRLSPTHFYPLLGHAATDEQARRMIDEHFCNPAEFAGEYILPSIARNDPAYGDQAYWRGRIWAPMNYLVYRGLTQYDLSTVRQARQTLADKSATLLLKEWREEGHIHENYNANTGDGDDIHSSDAFYHWGALLGLIGLMEAGHWPKARANAQ